MGSSSKLYWTLGDMYNKNIKTTKQDCENNIICRTSIQYPRDNPTYYLFIFEYDSERKIIKIKFSEEPSPYKALKLAREKAVKAFVGYNIDTATINFSPTFANETWDTTSNVDFTNANHYVLYDDTSAGTWNTGDDITLHSGNVYINGKKESNPTKIGNVLLNLAKQWH